MDIRKFCSPVVLYVVLVFMILTVSTGSSGCSQGKDLQRVEVVAHRGFSGIAPENTLAALNAAQKAGADRVEFDVHLTADGIPVVIHDRKLDRTTSGKGPVVGKTLEEIRKLDAGSWFDARFKGEPVPTLDEALALCKGRIAVNIEIKSEAVKGGKEIPPDGVEAKVVEAIRRHGLVDTAVVSSFEPLALERIHRLAPEVSLQSLYNGKRQKGLGPREVCGDHSRAFNCSMKEVTPEWIAGAHRAGLKINVYTVDDPEDQKKMIQLGVDGIITNWPDRLLSVLGRKPVK